MISGFDRGSSQPEGQCPFCAVVSTFEPFDPRSPPNGNSALLAPSSISPPCFVVLSTPSVIAFLDILPLSRGHLLLCPRVHRPKLTDISESEAAELGRYLRILSAALAQTTGVYDWNVVQNNGAAAAQVVPHMHFHLIPRPEIRQDGRYRESFTMFGRGTRQELDIEDAEQLATQIRQCVATIITTARANL
jgi:diadenosine tetraphosphate (Ap4A) HIT family hydrolase